MVRITVCRRRTDPQILKITLSRDRLGWMLQMASYDSEDSWQAVLLLGRGEVEARHRPP